jgi:hypothetical protein
MTGTRSLVAPYVACRCRWVTRELTLRHKMKIAQPNNIGNVVPFQAPSDDDRNPVEDPHRDNIIRMLDLSKFEQRRPDVEDYDASMRVNIAAMVLLGLLVFIAREDFSKLAQSHLSFKIGMNELNSAGHRSVT